MDGSESFALRADERPLLNRVTRLHGSPLYAALLTNGTDIFSELVLEQDIETTANSIVDVMKHA